MKLLIVDDESFIRNGLLSLEWGNIGIKEVFSASNGIEAKDILVDKNIDIVISDISMPGLNGLELTNFIKEAEFDTISILLTGYSDFDYAKQAIKNQVFDYLLKPIRPEELLITTKRAIETLKQKRQKNAALKQVEVEQVDFSTADKITNSFEITNPVITEIITKIANEFSTEITLNNFADDYHFTAIYLSRLIKKETGYSFVDILLSVRLTNAIQMLENREKINSICDKCGFKDQRYFSQVFKKVFECTPSEYKKLEGNIKFETFLDLLENIVSKKKIRDEDF